MGSRRPPPPPHGPYGDRPPQYTATTKERGLGGCSHGTHLMLTVLTCGLWGIFVWLPWWIFRVLVPKRRKTTYRPR